MLKIFKMTFLIFLILFCYCNESSLPPDFRNVRWGMSIDKVKAVEKEAKYSELIKNENIPYIYNSDTLYSNQLEELLEEIDLPTYYSDVAIIYDSKIAIEDSHSCNVTYMFKNDELIGSIYWIEFDSKFATVDNAELNSFLEKLKIKYGTPDQISRGRFHSDQKFWDGKEGDNYKWYTERTFIEVSIKYTGVRLVYRSVEYENKIYNI